MNTLKCCITILFIGSIIFLTSCDNSDSEPEAPKGTISATIGGSVISLTDAKAIVATGGGSITITGKQGSSDVVRISINSGVAEFTYQLPNQRPGEWSDAIAYDPGDGKGSFMISTAGTGKIVITEIDEENQTLKGTFEGVMGRLTEQATIVDGTFNVPYQLDETSGNLYVAKVDGKEVRGSVIASGYGSAINLGFGMGTKVITLELPMDATPGTYAIGGFGSDATSLFVDGIRSYEPTSGTVTVTSHADGSIAGTYSMVMESYPVAGTTVAITEGVFAVEYK
jgi:hypothetical protein